MPQFIQESIVLGPAFAAGIFGAFLLLAALVNIAFKIILGRYRRRFEEDTDRIDIDILSSLQGPAVLFLILFGLFLAFITLTQLTNPAFAVIKGLDAWGRKVWLIAIILQVSYVVTHVLQALVRWYIRKVTADARTVLDTKLGPTINRLFPVVIFSIGILISLDILGITISPLLAGLGIGGLAVALALTPTITSFIAGTYVVTEGQIKEGDFIEIDTDVSGTVIDVGWRSTVLRSFQNNIVVIPNSKITESVVTNYTTPTPVLMTIVECGVSYDSDLYEVERISLEVASEVIQESDDAVKDFEPRVRFREFADSNINFRVVTQATSRVGSFAMRHEIIKRLHNRFKKEGIEINYPMRKLVLPLKDGYLPIMNVRQSELKRDNGILLEDSKLKMAENED